jgi:putative glutamine amidotransferase
MQRPAIGICTALEDAQWGVWHRRAALLPFEYIVEIQKAGGLALMIAPDVQLEDDPDEVLDRLDGLILAGGADIDPQSYGAERHPETNGTVPERDRVEIALTRRAIECDMPVLGICRGMQLINVAQGGTLIQHVPDGVGTDDHRRNRGTFEGNGHGVRLAAGSLAARAAGEEQHETLSHHHQAIDALGEGLSVTGLSELDELPEAIEAADHRFVLGVQWHPEADERSRVISALVSEADAYRMVRGSA